MYTDHMNIYISKAVKPQLEKETNKSGLINDLLLRHYGLAPSSEQKHYPERFRKESQEETTPPKKIETPRVLSPQTPTDDLFSQPKIVETPKTDKLCKHGFSLASRMCKKGCK